MNGTYTEQLKSGGELRISAKEWTIEYYFPGPDMRYKGTFIRISGKKITEYIDAWEENFKEYLKLREMMPKDGSFEKRGKMEMTIRVGSRWRDGVCLDSYHMCIDTEDKIAAIKADYEYAKKRAEQMMEFLSKQ